MDFVTLGIAILVVACAIALSWALSKHFRMSDYFGKFTLVFVPLFAGLAVVALRYDQIRLGIDLRGGVILVYEVVGASERGSGAAEDANAPKTPTGSLSKADMDKLIEAISKRVNPSGTKEVTIRQFGPRQVEIIIPSDPNKEVDQAEVERLKRILGQAGNLEFRILATRMRHQGIIDRATAPAMQDKAQLRGPDGKLQAWWVPVKDNQRSHFEHDSTIVTRHVKLRDGKDQLQVLVVNDQYDVTGGYLIGAKGQPDDRGRLAVGFQFNSAGGRRFGGLTGSHTPDPAFNNQEYRLGIILDNVLYSAPTIRTTIFQNGEITGNFSKEEVDDLVAVLNAGALPATLNKQPISERLIGPTLGGDTIVQGVRSLALSIGLVFVFVLIYYRFAGIVACLTLTVNSILLLAIMILIHAPFTLPGLAGFALTIGMAVDANVLIYERMREEAARGAGIRMTIRNGFERAMSAIVDSNLSTLITAAVLWAIGTDQVRGFAVTLFLGIALSMYTAIFCAHVVFDVAERRRWIGERLRMMQMLPHTNIDFLGKKKVMIGISVAIILIGLVAAGIRSRGLFDIDFTGGVSIETVFEKPQKIADLRTDLQDLPDLVISDMQTAQDTEPGMRFMINTANPADVKAEDYLVQLKARLEKKYGDQLARNRMHFGSIVPTTVGGSAEKATAPPEKAATPKADQQGRMGGPGNGRSEWLALSTLLMGQADAAKTPPKEAAKEPPKPATAEPAKPAAKPAAEPSKPAAKETPKEPVKEPVKEAPKATETPKAKETAKEAAPPKPAPKAAETEAKPAGQPAAPNAVTTKLTFERPISHDALENVIKEDVVKKVGASLDLPADWSDFTLTNPNYVEGSGVRETTWDITIRLPEQRARELLGGVQQCFAATAFFPSSDTIGGAVAENTRYRAIMALLASSVFILLYLWVRFQRVTYGLGAVASLIHDVFIALAFVAGSYWLAQIPIVSTLLGIEPFKINLVMMAAFLTLAGYSLNDTIVCFDRIREIRGKAPQVTEAMINASINQVLARTILTGLTTLFSVLVLYILGGPTIHGFAYAMLVGVITGMYSSVFIASPFLLWAAGTKERPRERARTLQK